MDKFKKYLTPTLKILAFFGIYFILLAILNYTGITKLSTITKINFVFIAIICFIAGLRRGKKASKRGYLEGLKLGGIVILILFLLNLIFYRSFSLYVFLYYLIILVATVMGSMLGINLHR